VSKYIYDILTYEHIYDIISISMRIQDSGKEFGRWADKWRKFNIGFDTTLAATIGRGFFAGILVGYALKKVLKILAIVVGLFFADLAYLQYQHIVNWGGELTGKDFKQHHKMQLHHLRTQQHKFRIEAAG
jgi:uncharacterized membrane protein (Fun14 family)